MATASHQTVALSAGRHRGPDDGACVMELASMLAHEPFSDRPASVCPVIAGFLRSYNDHIDHERRRDLYRYAARVVGTRADAATELLRAEMCLRWARTACGPPPLRVRILHRLFRCQGPDVDGIYAARAAAATGKHERALAFLDDLITARADRAARGGRIPSPCPAGGWDWQRARAVRSSGERGATR